MLNVTRIKRADAASSYLSQADNYYRHSDLSPTNWEGKGAELLGLHGEVEGQVFNAILHGQLPNGTKLGNEKHCPGWDDTFSAPKSVSALALAGGDARLIEAHDMAVKAAIRHVEQHCATTRIKNNREVRTIATDNIVAATFRHSTSREQDPQLHTHAAILNATSDNNGQWRSFESQAMFRMQKELDYVYKNELARYCNEVGYHLEATKYGFEIAGVSKELINKWSSRNEQINSELEKIGKTRETSTAGQREVAALNSRKNKGKVDHASLRSKWYAEARIMGANLQQVINLSKQNAVPTANLVPPMCKAIQAVEMAADHLSERQSCFSAHDLEKEAMRFAGIGECSKDEFRQAIELTLNEGKLQERQTFAHNTHIGQKDYVDGYTTSNAADIITQFDKRDRDLAREALLNYEHGDDASHFRGDRENDVKRMFKDGGKRVYDNAGRLFVRARGGRIYAPDLYRMCSIYERNTLHHLNLTKTKYISHKDGRVSKLGGTLKLDPRVKSDDPMTVKRRALNAFIPHEIWNRCGAIESAVVKNIILSKGESQQILARQQLEQQSKKVKFQPTKEQALVALKALESKTDHHIDDTKIQTRRDLMLEESKHIRRKLDSGMSIQDAVSLAQKEFAVEQSKDKPKAAQKIAEKDSAPLMQQSQSGKIRQHQQLAPSLRRDVSREKVTGRV